MSTFAYCHFCDDIRYEVGFKISLMGIYGSELLVDQMPTHIQKICIAAFCNTPADKPFESLAAKIYLGDKILQEHAIPKDELLKMHEQISNMNDLNEPLQRHSIGLNLVVSPLLIEAPGILKVVMVANSEEHVAGKLRMRLSESSKNQ